MEPALGAAAQALAAFDPLGALKRIALLDDPEALALRGVAMAQLGDYPAARKLLGRAARGFGQSDPRARARCLAASGEVALASRDLAAAFVILDEAVRELDAHGDRLNALFVRLQRLQSLEPATGAMGRAIDVPADAGTTFDGTYLFYRTYFINSRGDEAMGTLWGYLDMTALGRQEEWEDSPEGYPQTAPYKWWNWHDDYDAEAKPDATWVERTDAAVALRK